MLLYFLRHGIAEEATLGQPDFARQLTDKGRERMVEEGKALAKLGIEVGLILTSPAVRARQTAEIVAEALGGPVEEEKGLGGGCELSRLAEALEGRRLPEAVMLVGHEPDFSETIGELIGGGRVAMKKGAVACLEVTGVAGGGATLLWLITGKQLAAMA
jgi:phosphohistidine phosphatase